MEKANQRRAVTVRKLPANLDEETEQFFLRDAESCLNGRRPALVLDCAGVPCLDKHGIWLMVRCLEEAMKRNGDVRLAGVGAEARAALEAAGLGRLFRIYETNAEAIASFQQPLGYGIPHTPAKSSQPHAARNAA
jgi:anti-sigma B factor antagonist